VRVWLLLMTCAVPALVGCAGSQGERTLSLTAVESALRVAGIRHFQVLAAPHGEHLVLPSHPPFGAQFMVIRVLSTVRAAKDSHVIAQAKKYFPRENAHDRRVCNVLLFPESLVPSLPERPTPADKTSYARVVRATDQVGQRLAAELERRCVTP
jgi:hypothetical protein